MFRVTTRLPTYYLSLFLSLFLCLSLMINFTLSFSTTSTHSFFFPAFAINFSLFHLSLSLNLPVTQQTKHRDIDLHGQICSVRLAAASQTLLKRELFIQDCLQTSEPLKLLPSASNPSLFPFTRLTLPSHSFLYSYTYCDSTFFWPFHIPIRSPMDQVNPFLGPQIYFPSQSQWPSTYLCFSGTPSPELGDLKRNNSQYPSFPTPHLLSPFSLHLAHAAF